MSPRGVGQQNLKPSRPFSGTDGGSPPQVTSLTAAVVQPSHSCPIIQSGGNRTSPDASDITHSLLPKECLPRSINITVKQ